jgi:ABC-type lipoprotein export system ATPase subunit
MNHRRLQERQLLESPHDLTVIVITHEPDITAYADRVLQFRDGELIKDSPQDQPSGLAVGDKL